MERRTNFCVRLCVCWFVWVSCSTWAARIYTGSSKYVTNSPIVFLTGESPASMEKAFLGLIRQGLNTLAAGPVNNTASVFSVKPPKKFLTLSSLPSSSSAAILSSLSSGSASSPASSVSASLAAPVISFLAVPLDKKPFQYVSNAQPNKVIFNHERFRPRGKIQKLFKKHNSKVVRLNLKFLSNGKPVRALANPFGINKKHLRSLEKMLKF